MVQSSSASETMMNIEQVLSYSKKTMSQLPCTSHRVVYAITVMGKVRLLAVVVGEWAVPVWECSILNVFCVVAREKLNAEFVEVLAKENVIKDEKYYIIFIAIIVLWWMQNIK